jgi:transketolase
MKMCDTLQKQFEPSMGMGENEVLMMSKDEKSRNDLLEMACRIRRHTIEMTHTAKASHVGSSLSIVKLLVVLYKKILRIDPSKPEWPNRDCFILSKGHGCAAYYAVLAEVGFFPTDWLQSFYQNGSRLAGHVTHAQIPGVEISTGSLGHGLSIATGMAYAAKLSGRSQRIFCMLSDGECDEGSVWEPAMFASHYRLDNLITIVDYNKIQSLGTVKEVMGLEPFGDKWQAFGWTVREIDGHDIKEIETNLKSIPFQQAKPSCIIAHTIKGKGISFMENRLLWHYRSPQDEEFEAALRELETAQ